ncbi:uncharacterized protein TNCV_513081, partial [Trichonephila clavipes]
GGQLDGWKWDSSGRLMLLDVSMCFVVLFSDFGINTNRRFCVQKTCSRPTTSYNTCRRPFSSSSARREKNHYCAAARCRPLSSIRKKNLRATTVREIVHNAGSVCKKTSCVRSPNGRQRSRHRLCNPTAAVASFSVQTCFIGERSGDLAGHGRHILEDIVGRVAQYVDEHYPVDKWHLGDLIACGSTIGVKISSTYLRAVKVPLKDHSKMIVCPKKLLPTLSHLCEIAVCRFDNKCRIGPLAGAPPDTCAVVISTETESGFITEDDTLSSLSHSKLPEVGKIQSTLPMMWGQW